VKIENKIWVWEGNKKGKLEWARRPVDWVGERRDSMMRLLMVVVGIGIISSAIWGGITGHLSLQGALLVLILFILAWK